MYAVCLQKGEYICSLIIENRGKDEYYYKACYERRCTGII